MLMCEDVFTKLIQFQLLIAVMAWYINNVVQCVLQHVIMMMMFNVLVVVLKDVSVQLEWYYLMDSV